MTALSPKSSGTALALLLSKASQLGVGQPSIRQPRADNQALTKKPMQTLPARKPANAHIARASCSTLQHTGSLLNELSQHSDMTEEHCALFCLLNEQIAFTAPIHRYSAETLVFSSILNSIFLHAYNFARSASMLTALHP